MSLKLKLIAHWHKFLQVNFNTYLRNAPPIGKDRKYKHVDIQQQFDQYEQDRRKQRLQLIEHKQQLRKKILEKELKLISQVDLVQDKAVTQNSELNQEIIQRLTNQLSEPQDQRKQVITKQLADITEQLKQIEKERIELKDVSQQIVQLEPDMVILQGPEKNIVLNMIHYYEFQQRHVTGVFLNPETKKAMEIVHYHLQNNLPVKRDLLYEVVPELFEKEIGELDEYRQKLIEEKRPQLISDQQTILQIVQKLPKQQDKLDFYEQLKDQEMEMMDFVYKNAQNFCDKHDQYIAMKLDQGLPTVEEIFDVLCSKENLTEQEQQILEDYNELKKVNDDYNQLMELNKIRVFQEQRELHIPDFVKQNDTLCKAWVEKWETLIKNSFDIQDSFLLPVNNTYESKLDEAISEYRKQDISELIEESQQEYKQLTDIPIRKNDRLQKDQALVKKMSVLTSVMHSLPEKKKVKRITNENNVKYKDDPLLSYRGEEQRILMDEFPKIIYLNNSDPQKYNLVFWAKHFNIEPQKLRNIFNFISYPIISADNKQETTRILRFITFSQDQ